MDESTLPNAGEHVEEHAAPEAAPVEAPPAPPSTGSRILTIGILACAVALAVVWIKQDMDHKAPKQDGKGDTAKGSDGPSPIKIGAAAPALVLKDLDGRTVTLTDLKGKVVMVDFWATWCEPCQIMIPWLVEMHNRYASQGLEIVGVAMDDDQKDVRPFVEKAKMNYPILYGNDTIADSWGGVFGLPTSFLIDRDGKIRATHQGLVGKDVLEKDIKGLLQP